MRLPWLTGAVIAALSAMTATGCTRGIAAGVTVHLPASPETVLLRMPATAAPAPADVGRAAALRLMRAQVLLQLDRPQEAMPDCIAIQRQVSWLVFATCAAQVRAGLGDPRGGAALVEAALNAAPASSGTDAVRSWSAGVAGELAQKLGEQDAAGRWYAQAWRTDPASHFARLKYADWLRAHRRQAEAARLMAGQWAGALP